MEDASEAPAVDFTLSGGNRGFEYVEEVCRCLG